MKETEKKEEAVLLVAELFNILVGGFAGKIFFDNPLVGVVVMLGLSNAIAGARFLSHRDSNQKNNFLPRDSGDPDTFGHI